MGQALNLGDDPILTTLMTAAENRQPPLPDLCRLPVVLTILLVGELLVAIYVLSTSPVGQFEWERLALLSLYVQWAALLATIGICQLGKRMLAHSATQVGLASFGWVLVVGVLTNTFAQWVYGGGDWRAWSMGWLFRDLVIVAVLAGIALRYLFLQQRWRQEQLAAQSAKIDALNARIRPHFLFNSMNTIASLIGYAPEDAERAVEDLSSLFRASLSNNETLVPWEREREICQAYLRIEQLRLGDRMQVQWRDEAMPAGFTLPALSVQPLLENAIYHGIELLSDGGLLSVAVSVAGDSVHVSVANPLVAQAARTPASEQRNGIALQNIQSRLAAIYASDRVTEPLASLALSAGAEHFVAELTLPWPWPEA